jgi:isoleucyl-tRNA synthetase
MSLTRIPKVPEKPSLDGIEVKWSAVWNETGIYNFDRTKTRDQVFSIDTPPPTVSGSLHVGHVFQLHPHGLHCALQAHAWLRSFLPHGLG